MELLALLLQNTLEKSSQGTLQDPAIEIQITVPLKELLPQQRFLDISSWQRKLPGPVVKDLDIFTLYLSLTLPKELRCQNIKRR